MSARCVRIGCWGNRERGASRLKSPLQDPSVGMGVVFDEPRTTSEVSRAWISSGTEVGQ